MLNVLLVEPDDESCLMLWQSIVQAGGCVTITDSAACAREALRDNSHLSLLITNAFLPDGRGSEVAQEAATLGTPSLIVRNGEDIVEISNEHGVVFHGTDIEAMGFVKEVLRRGLSLWRGQPSSGTEKKFDATPIVDN